MIDRMMFAIPFQGLITTKRIGVIDGPLPGFSLDMPHEFLGTHRLDDFGVDAGFPLQEPKDDAFARRGSASLPLTPSPKVGFIQFNLALEFAAFQLGQMVQRFSHPLIDSSDHFDIDPQILAQPIGRLELLEPLENRNFSTQPTQTFTLSTELTFHIAPTGVQDLEGAAENTLATSQNVGRTTKNRVPPSNHAHSLIHIGYETP